MPGKKKLHFSEEHRWRKGAPAKEACFMQLEGSIPPVQSYASRCNGGLLQICTIEAKRVCVGWSVCVCVCNTPEYQAHDEEVGWTYSPRGSLNTTPIA